MKRMFLFMAGIGIAAATFAENRQPNTSQDAKSIVRLSVAFMAIGEHEIQKIGNLPSDTGVGALQPTVVSNILYELTHGNNPSNMACVRASLDNTKHFFAQSGIIRMSDTGSAFIEGGSKSGVKFKCGDTWFVKVYDGDSADLKGIDYGITISADGGRVNDTMLSFDLGYDIRTIIPHEDGTCDWHDFCSKREIICPIGRTMLVSGVFDMFGKHVPSSAFPFFRSVPLLNWFLTDCGKAISDRRLVIMICPEIVDGTQNVTPDGNKVVNIPMPKPGEPDGGHECEACKKRGGFLSWLDWFMF